MGLESNAKTLIEEVDERLSLQIKDSSKKVSSLIMKPLYVETMVSMGKYGTGTPSGVANYPGGNYVCNINGTKGDKFVTVTGGVIADGGGVWNAVIQDQNLNCTMNKVVSITSNRFNLIDPLQSDIVNGKIGNLHDAPLGLHYTELGYYAFAQTIYNTNPMYCDREKNDVQFLGSDTSSTLWNINTSFSIFNNVTNINNTDDNTLAYLGGAHLDINLADPNHYAKFDYLAKDKGYIELYLSSKKPSTLVCTKNGVNLSYTINKVLQRIIIDFARGDTLTVKISDSAASGSNINTLSIGNTTVFLNSVNLSKLIQPNDKVAYIGDSWGVYHNQATTRELQRLMNVEGGTGSVSNYSRSGHTSAYALHWFNEYIVKTQPDKVIIEYYCNDFASINGTDIGTFTNMNGQPQDMNISSMAVYLNNLYQMINMAIQNGIQPIVILPNVTDALSRVQDFTNRLAKNWLGESMNKTVIDTIELNVKSIKQTGTPNVGNTLEIVSTEVNSASRQGTVFDTDKAITGGNLLTVKNFKTTKMGVRYDGTPFIPQMKITPQYGTQATILDNRGLVYVFDGQGGNTKTDDELRIVAQKADGSYGTFKLAGTWI